MPGGRFFRLRRNRPSARPTRPCAARTCAGSRGSSSRTSSGSSAVLALIVFAAALGVVPAFLLRDVLNGDRRLATSTLLSYLAAGMIAIAVVTGALGVHPDAALEPGRPARDARPARGGLPPPAAAVARVLHAHAHRRGAVADLERHRRRAERRHEHRDVDRVERHDRRRDDGRHVPAELAARALRVRADPASSCCSRGASATSGARSRRRRRRRSPTSRASCRSRCRSRGSCSARRWGGRRSSPTASRPTRCGLADLEVQSADGRPLGDGVDPDELLPSCPPRCTGSAGSRSRAARGDRRRDARRVHHAADAAVLPGRLAARRRRRRADVARALRPDLRVPRPADRHRREAGRGRARRRRRRRRRSTTSGSATATTWTLEDVDVHGPAGHDDRARRRDRRGQDDARLPRRAALRRRARARSRSTASTSAT